MVDGWSDLAYALGNWSGRSDGRNGPFVDGPREKWKPNPKIIKAAIQFVMKMERFQLRATIVEDICGGTGGVGVAETDRLGHISEQMAS
jgi:hypothetical protein